MLLRNIKHNVKISLRKILPILAKAIYKYESPFSQSPFNNLGDKTIAHFTQLIDFNFETQLELFSKILNYAEEFNYPENQNLEDIDRYFIKNEMYEELDGFILYAMIRHFKPKKIIEIGSGHSTKLCVDASNKNYNNCLITCIEPYRSNVIENLNVRIVKEKVENCPLSIFDTLEKNDFLIIDSSHIIKPYGDVIWEYLHILPKLKPGVIVHIHDIFLPFDYPKQWMQKEYRLYTEQWLLAAFLYQNNLWDVLFSAYPFFKNNYPLFKTKLKGFNFKVDINVPPSSFWIQKKDVL